MPTNSLNNPTSPASPVGAGRSHLAKPRRRTRLAAILAAAMLSLTPLATAQDAAPDATPATPPAEQILADPPASPPAGQPAGQPAEPAPETSVPPAPVTAPAAAPIAAPTTARPLPAPRPIAAPPPQPATDSATDPTDPADPADPADPNAPAPAPQGPTPLGSEDGLDKAFIEFTSLSAGIASISLPDSYNSVGHESHIQLQQIVTVNDIAAVPFAILAIEVNGDTVPMASVAGAPRIWNQASPGVFVAHIDAPDGSPLVRITRAYALNISERYGFTVSTTLENLSAAPVTARVIQTGPIDLPRAENNYAGDKRRIRFGYMQPPELQLGDRTVTVDTDLAPRTDLLGKRITTPSGFKIYPAQNTVWPTLKAQERGHRLSWLAFSDRYFAVAVHPLFDPAAVSSPDDKLLKGLGPIDRLLLNPGAPAPDTVMVVRFNGVPVTLAPGASETHAFGVYAGPMSRPTIRQDALLASLRMPEMVVYNLGGFCAPCTFAWLTDSLMGILRLFHTFTGDWAIAIMLLVVLVRAVLHPVTRWSQIRMQKFGAQMQAMGPKQAKLKEKYKDEPKKLQQEMAKLWKEEGISPAGMLGCLPMFLQSPVWIALYATLFFAIELRQEPAFYGIFQTLTNGSWQFLADLAEPDHAIPLPFSQSIPLWGTVSAVNILPLLLGVVFYAHQKFLTPPTSASMTPEQIQQQKIIKVMMVVMFPLMMYAAPSGLALYFITNSVLGIFEHKWIRAHMDKHGMLDPEKIKAERQTKGPGFMARMSEAAETQRKIQAQAHGGRPPLIPDKKRNKKKK